jgi:hypothetical protein
MSYTAQDEKLWEPGLIVKTRSERLMVTLRLPKPVSTALCAVEQRKLIDTDCRTNKRDEARVNRQQNH